MKLKLCHTLQGILAVETGDVLHLCKPKNLNYNCNVFVLDDSISIKWYNMYLMVLYVFDGSICI